MSAALAISVWQVWSGSSHSLFQGLASFPEARTKKPVCLYTKAFPENLLAAKNTSEIGWVGEGGREDFMHGEAAGSDSTCNWSLAMSSPARLRVSAHTSLEQEARAVAALGKPEDSHFRKNPYRRKSVLVTFWEEVQHSGIEEEVPSWGTSGILGLRKRSSRWKTVKAVKSAMLYSANNFS